MRWIGTMRDGMTFFPWRDDVLCDAESPYALLNKASWFVCGGPGDLLRGDAVRGADYCYDEPEAWIDRLDDAVFPQVNGVALGQRAVQLARQLRQEVPVPWRRHQLAVCPACIAGGVHLRVHQHFAVACCPVHPDQRLVSACPRCSRMLPFRIHRRQPAFCCLPHGHSLLAPAQRLSASAKTWARLVRQAGDAQAWLDDLHARVPLGDANLGPEAAEPVPFRRRLALEAALRSRTRVPSWVLRMDVPAQLALRTVPASRWQTHAASSAVGGDPAPCGVEDDVTRCVARLACSLRLSAKAFLVRYGADHAHCLDRPYHLLGSWLNPAPSDARLLTCCPVSIGFWLWRLRWAPALAALRGASGLQNHTTLDVDYRCALGGLVRSHLHLCVVMARQAVRAHRLGAASEATLQTLRGLLGDPGDTACSIASDVSMQLAGVPTCWTLDVTDAPVGRRGRLSSLDNGGVRNVPCEDGGGGAYRPGGSLPFTPMRHDVALLLVRRRAAQQPATRRSRATQEQGQGRHGGWWSLPIVDESSMPRTGGLPHGAVRGGPTVDSGSAQN